LHVRATWINAHRFCSSRCVASCAAYIACEIDATYVDFRDYVAYCDRVCNFCRKSADRPGPKGWPSLRHSFGAAKGCPEVQRRFPWADKVRAFILGAPGILGSLRKGAAMRRPRHPEQPGREPGVSELRAVLPHQRDKVTVIQEAGAGARAAACFPGARGSDRQNPPPRSRISSREAGGEGTSKTLARVWFLSVAPDVPSRHQYGRGLQSDFDGPQNPSAYSPGCSGTHAAEGSRS